MKRHRHKRYGGGLGGTTANSVLTLDDYYMRPYYATEELFEQEKRAFAAALREQRKHDQTMAIRYLGDPKRKTKAP